MGGGRLRRHHGRDDWQPYGITDETSGRPIISQVVMRGDMVYVCGVTPDSVGDITSQTQ